MSTQRTFTEILSSQTSNLINILRLPEVKRRTGYSRSTIYLKVNQGDFPQPIALGARAIGWLESEINDWIVQRVANSRTRLGGKNHDT